MSKKIKISPTMNKKIDKKKIVKCQSGIVRINASVNNTILAFTNSKGDVLTQVSCGSAGFKNCKKNTYHAIQTTFNAFISRVKEMGVQMIDIIIKGIGPASNMVALLQGLGANIGTISDVTPIKHGGTYSRRERRQ